MKTTLIILTLVMSSMAIAESKAPRSERGERGERITERLNLTEAQQEQFKLTMQNKHEKMQAAMEVVHEETKAELATFLTEDQLQQMEDSMEKRHELRKHSKDHKQMRQHRSAPNN